MRTWSVSSQLTLSERLTLLMYVTQSSPESFQLGQVAPKRKDPRLLLAQVWQKRNCLQLHIWYKLLSQKASSPMGRGLSLFRFLEDTLCEESADERVYLKSRRRNNCIFQMTNLILLLPCLKIFCCILFTGWYPSASVSSSGSRNSCSCRLFCTASVIFPCPPDRRLFVLTDGFYCWPSPKVALLCSQGILFTYLYKSKCEHIIIKPWLFLPLVLSRMGIKFFIFVPFLVPRRQPVKFASRFATWEVPESTIS